VVLIGQSSKNGGINGKTINIVKASRTCAHLVLSFFHPRMGAQSFRTTTLNTKWIDRTTFPTWLFLSSNIDFTAGNRTVPPSENMAMWHFPPTLNCRRESIVWVKKRKKKNIRILRVHFYIMFNFISVDGEISPKFGQQSISPCFGLCTFWGLCSRPCPGILSQNWIQTQKIKGRSCSNRYSF